MNANLKVTYLYHDTDIVEVRIAVDNASFRGTANVYVGAGQLTEAAAMLEGFPKDNRDKREIVFGAAGPGFAGGSVRIAFYCKDQAGHAAFQARIEEEYQEREQAQSATIFADFEPAGLDQFIIELRQIEILYSGFAGLSLQAT